MQGRKMQGRKMHGRQIKKCTLTSLINVQSLITVQGDKFSKKNKHKGQKKSSISVQVSFFSENTFTLALLLYCFFMSFCLDRQVTNQNW